MLRRTSWMTLGRPTILKMPVLQWDGFGWVDRGCIVDDRVVNLLRRLKAEHGFFSTLFLLLHDIKGSKDVR